MELLFLALQIEIKFAQLFEIHQNLWCMSKLAYNNISLQNNELTHIRNCIHVKSGIDKMINNRWIPTPSSTVQDCLSILCI